MLADCSRINSYPSSERQYSCCHSCPINEETDNKYDGSNQKVRVVGARQVGLANVFLIARVDDDVAVCEQRIKSVERSQ